MPNDHLEPLPCVELDPAGPVRAVVLWLHGLGADGHDFEPIVPLLELPEALGVRFVFPTAPSIPVSVNAGFVMPAWYDIHRLDLDSRDQDEAGIRASIGRVRDLVARERERGVPSERIVLAGFSQGGAVGIHAALGWSERLAGLLALSTYLVLPSDLESERTPVNADIPILQAHGRFDPMVPLARGEEARDRLRSMGYDVTWEEYPIQHEVSPAEIMRIGAWLRERLAPVG